MILHYNLFIAGKFIESKNKQSIINPATSEPIAEVSVASTEDIEYALSAARKAFDSGTWKNLSLPQRKEYILKISQGILDKAQELASLESLNTGKPIKETTFMDIPSSAATFEYFANNLEKFLSEENIEINSQIANAKSKLIREPQGVVVLIVPWNYPLLITSWKMAQALAAGNTVILKPSSLTPLTALELGKIVNDAGLPVGVVNIINASGEQIGKTLCADKRVDMISFTGSNVVGKKIMEYAASNVKKMTIELGGKSASIILKDTDLELAVNGSLCSIFLNQGQMCTAMSRIFVQDEIYDNFVNDFITKAKRIKLGNPEDFETQMGPLISKPQLEKIISYVEKAKKEGAKLVCGGKVPDNTSLKQGFFFEPTVFVDVSRDMTIFKEEIFGPIVCIIRFKTEEEAIKLANDSDFGLAACLWTKNQPMAEKISKALNAGTIWVNTYGMFFNELPYGGFKQSGFGKELGREGFLEYTRLKNVIMDNTKEAKPLVNYWYGF